MNYRIEINHDLDLPAGGLLDMADYPGKTEEDFVSLEVLLYDGRKYLGGLGGITFFVEGTDWDTGEFDAVEDIPEACTYLREIAEELLDEHVYRPEADRYLSLL